MTNEQKSFVEPILCTFENEDIRNFAVKLLEDLPEYIWEVGASSTGKYHPAYTLGKLGLMKHQIAVVRFLNFFFELDQYKNRFNSRHRDLLRVAALIHDGRKSGSQNDYEKSKYTKFDHPLVMAESIRFYKNKGFLDYHELEYIALAISSHMGQWNTDKRSGVTLPTPNDEAGELMHLADYLASRKCLNMSFDDYVVPNDTNVEVSSKDFVITFGKHKGSKLGDIPKDYLSWLSMQDIGEPLQSHINKVLKS